MGFETYPLFEDFRKSSKDNKAVPMGFETGHPGRHWQGKRK